MTAVVKNPWSAASSRLLTVMQEEMLLLVTSHGFDPLFLLNFKFIVAH
jgi:hypothetical protein